MKKRGIWAFVASIILVASTITCIEIAEPIHAYAAQMNATGEVSGSGVNVRNGAGTDADKIGTLSGGETVTIIGEEGGWYKIEFEDGEGYVSADYVEVVEEDIEEDITADDEENIDEEALEDEEVSSNSLEDYKTILIILGAIVVVVIIIMLTIKSIKKIDDDDYGYDDYDDYDDDYDDDYEDDYEDDYDRAPVRRSRPVEDRRPPQERRPEPVRRQQVEPVRKPQAEPKPEPVRLVKPDPTMFMSDNPDDYRIDIDPKYFETTSIPKIDDDDAPIPVNASSQSSAPKPVNKGSDKDAEIAAAMKKMEELKAEIERIKNEN